MSNRWLNRTVAGIILATFLSDFSHEMATAVLPMFLASLHLGAAALGVIEGLADFLVSLAKLGGGILGHHVRRKKPWTALGYALTALATAGIALATTLAALVSLRCAAWIARGYRGPLRDYLLADAVEKEYYGRAYGLERVGDMLGAVVGPLTAALLLWFGLPFRTIILWTVLPGLLAAAAMFFLTRERIAPPAEPGVAPPPRQPFPRPFKLFLVGVFFFGLGDFSRTFLVLLTAGALGETEPGGTLSLAVLLYAMHNLVSAGAAYPIGSLGDRRGKRGILIAGYALGVLTNVLLALGGGTIGWLAAAIVMSGVYIAAEETLEKAAAAELLPRELRSLGFGVLACVNAVGDMVSSLAVGFLLDADLPAVAFGSAAAVGAVGVAWMIWLARRTGFSLTTPPAAG